MCLHTRHASFQSEHSAIVFLIDITNVNALFVSAKKSYFIEVSGIFVLLLCCNLLTWL